MAVYIFQQLFTEVDVNSARIFALKWVSRGRNTGSTALLYTEKGT
jgi:hypothetical protein